MANGGGSKADILKAVRSPLAFFALALLMIEVLIVALSVTESSQLLTLTYLATGMFCLVVIAVFVLVATRALELLAESPSDLLPSLERVLGLVGTINAKKELGTKPLSSRKIKQALTGEVQFSEEGIPLVIAPPPGKI